MAHLNDNHLVRLQRILDATTEGFWEWNIETNATYYSPAWYDMLGLEPADSTTSVELWRARIHPDDRNRVLEVQQRSILKDEPWEQEYRMQHASGHFLWVLSRGRVLYRSGDGKPLLAGGLHIDITTQKQLHRLNEDLQTQERLIQGILKISLSSVTLYDFMARRLSFTSGHIMKSIGYEEQEFLGLSVDFYRGVIHPDDQLKMAQHVEQLVESKPGQMLECRIRLRSKQGLYHHLLLRDSVFSRDPDGKPQEVLCSAVDITRYLELKDKLEENLRFLRELSFRNSHEMRAPVASMLGLVDIMRHEVHSPASMNELIAYLKETITKMDSVIRELTVVLNDKISRH